MRYTIFLSLVLVLSGCGGSDSGSESNSGGVSTVSPVDPWASEIGRPGDYSVSDSELTPKALSDMSNASAIFVRLVRQWVAEASVDQFWAATSLITRGAERFCLSSGSFTTNQGSDYVEINFTECASFSPSQSNDELIDGVVRVYFNSSSQISIQFNKVDIFDRYSGSHVYQLHGYVNLDRSSDQLTSVLVNASVKTPFTTHYYSDISVNFNDVTIFSFDSQMTDENNKVENWSELTGRIATRDVASFVISGFSDYVADLKSSLNNLEIVIYDTSINLQLDDGDNWSFANNTLEIYGLYNAYEAEGGFGLFNPFLAPSRATNEVVYHPTFGMVFPNSVERYINVYVLDEQGGVLDNNPFSVERLRGGFYRIFFDGPSYYDYTIRVADDLYENGSLTISRWKRVFIDRDTDNDGELDRYDEDDDGDGHLDRDDEFDQDATEWADTDKDGIGDNSDDDADNDGVRNDLDARPHDPLCHDSSQLVDEQCKQHVMGSKPWGELDDNGVLYLSSSDSLVVNRWDANTGLFLADIELNKGNIITDEANVQVSVYYLNDSHELIVGYGNNLFSKIDLSSDNFEETLYVDFTNFNVRPTETTRSIEFIGESRDHYIFWNIYRLEEDPYNVDVDWFTVAKDSPMVMIDQREDIFADDEIGSPLWVHNEEAKFCDVGTTINEDSGKIQVLGKRERNQENSYYCGMRYFYHITQPLSKSKTHLAALNGFIDAERNYIEIADVEYKEWAPHWNVGWDQDDFVLVEDSLDDLATAEAFDVRTFDTSGNLLDERKEYLQGVWAGRYSPRLISHNGYLVMHGIVTTIDGQRITYVKSLNK